VAKKKRGERGNAFKVTNQRGQLGHLQAELVSPLWPLNAEINVQVYFKIQFQRIFLYLIPRLSLYFVDSYICCRTVTGPPVNDTRGRWRPGGGINVPATLKIVLREGKARMLKREIEARGIEARIQSTE